MKIAINKNVVNKPDEAGNKSMTFTYENVDITPEELAVSVAQGHSYCGQHKNSCRKSANFTGSDYLSVDIDKNMKLEEAVENEYVQANASFIYTTASHTEEFPKFRIVFVLPRTITKSTEMNKAYLGLQQKFGGDAACTDACRQFYGSKGGQQFFIGKSLPEAELDILLILADEKKLAPAEKAEGSTRQSRPTGRSSIILDPNQVIKLKNGKSLRLKDIQKSESVHCPVHVDITASAFTTRSQSGVPAIHCSTCHMTYFASSKIDEYDFNYSVDYLRCRTERQRDLEVDCEASLEAGSISGDQDEPPWQFINEKYLPKFELSESLIFVKSPKGSGKTEWLKFVVEQCKIRKLSVLLIGHRQSLIIAIADRLGLTSYISQSADGGKKYTQNRPSKYYAICVNSITKRLDTITHKYDVVLVDEVEQVFSHLTSGLLKEDRSDIYQYFKHYVDTAKQAYFLDADLNRLTIDTVDGFLTDVKKPAKVIINDYKANNEVINVYENESHLTHELFKSIEHGVHCFVCSNSKKKINKLFKSALDKLPNHKFSCITGDNSDEIENQVFIRNIASGMLQIDAIFVSPVIGTGVDITYSKSERKVCVFGFYDAGINTHFDIDQQISRVRHPIETNIWVTPQAFQYETNPEVIKREIELTDTKSRKILNIKPDGTHVYDYDECYTRLVSEVRALQRASKNRLKKNFIELKEFQGYKITVVDTNLEKRDEGKSIIHKGSVQEEADYRNQLLSAKVITKYEVSRLLSASKNHTLTPEQSAALGRYKIESFYYDELSEELIQNDKHGNWRSQIRLYEIYNKSADILMELDKDQDQLHSTDKRNYLLKQKLLREILTAAGLANDKQAFITDKQIRSDQLKLFSDYCKKNKPAIENLLNTDIRRDISTKPVQQLGKILKLMGVYWPRAKTKKEGDRKIYLYQIPQDVIDDLDMIISRRCDVELAEKWHLDRYDHGNRMYDESHDIYTYNEGGNLDHIIREQISTHFEGQEKTYIFKNPNKTNDIFESVAV